MSKKLIPFDTLQSMCCKRDFTYMGESGRFFVRCMYGFDNCNHKVCPVWAKFPDYINGNQPVKEIPQLREDYSLRRINLKLREGR